MFCEDLLDKIPSDFNINLYREINSDLKHLNNTQLIEHYINFGKMEDRHYKYEGNLPDNFNYQEYKSLNKDLSSLQESELKHHYLIYGKKEKRKFKFYFPKDFNVDEYKDIYFLPSTYNNEDIKLHYIINRYKYYKRGLNCVDIEHIDKINIKYRKKAYILCNINEGGTSKYLNDLISSFKSILFIFIINNSSIYNIKFEREDIILIQQLLGTNIKYEDIKYIKENYSCKLLLTIHDFYWFNDKIIDNFCIDPNNLHGNYLNKDLRICDNIKNLFNICDVIIHPSKFTFDEYSKYFDNRNFKLLPHIDESINRKLKIPAISNEINIGVLHFFTECKGAELIEYLRVKYKSYMGYKINFKISDVNIDTYDEDNFYEYIKIHNIHGLTLLNKWGETYCYALTKFLNSGLPIIYNNYGSFKERIINFEGTYKVFENEDEFYNLHLLNSKFECFIEGILKN